MGQLAFSLMCKEGQEGRGAGGETGRRLLQGSGQAVMVAWTRVSATRTGRCWGASRRQSGWNWVLDRVWAMMARRPP